LYGEKIKVTPSLEIDVDPIDDAFGCKISLEQEWARSEEK